MPTKRTVNAVKLTKRTVDAAKAKADRYFIWDAELKGFGLLVLPTGVKSYCLQYRTPEGTKRRATIAKHGTITPDQARTKAEAMRRAIHDGRDPLGEKQDRRNSKLVSDLFDAYLASDKFAEKYESTRYLDRGRIERHLRPLLGRKHVINMTPEDVRRTFAAIRDGKTAADVKTKKRGRARVTGGPTAARSCIELLRAIFTWAIEENITKTNPCVGVKLPKSNNRDTILEQDDDYARLFQALSTMEAQKRIRSPVADIIRVIALTGARRNEIASLRWSHVDLKEGRITLPPLGHKSGKSTGGKPRIIVLPAAAQAIIAKQPNGDDKAYVFAPAKGVGPAAVYKPWLAVRAAAKLPERIGLHGLRHTLASHLAMNGAEAAEIMAALGHHQLSTAQRYVHWAKDARQVLAEKAAKVALAGMAASTREAAPVVEMDKGRKK
jgi:integrase